MPRPRGAHLGRPLGGLVGHALQPRFLAGRGGRGVPVVALRRAAKQLLPPPPNTPVRSCACRLGAPGTWQLREVGPSFLPFHREENCSPGWLCRSV